MFVSGLNILEQPGINLRSCRSDVGCGKFCIAVTFSGTGVIPWSSIMWPKKFNFETAKSHLLTLIFKPKCASLSKTCNKWFWYSLISRLAIMTSSIHAKANGNPLNTSSMSLWKVWAALSYPNGILVN